MPRSKLAKSMATLKHTEKTQDWAIRGLLIRVLLGEKTYCLDLQYEPFIMMIAFSHTCILMSIKFLMNEILS